MRQRADHPLVRRAGARAHGVDLAQPLLDAVRPTLPPGATVSVADVLRDDLPTEPFDLVYDSGCFHHGAAPDECILA